MNIKTVLSVFGAFLFGVVMLSPVSVSAQSNEEEKKVTICHATASGSNEFVSETIAESAVLNAHAGPDHQNGEDIIPPFGDFAGQNWDAEGQATLRNNCVATTTPVTPTPGTTEEDPEPQVLAATTETPTQVVAPQGGVAAGVGGLTEYNPVATVGLGISLISVVAGTVLAVRRRIV